MVNTLYALSIIGALYCYIDHAAIAIKRIVYVAKVVAWKSMTHYLNESTTSADASVEAPKL